MSHYLQSTDPVNSTWNLQASLSFPGFLTREQWKESPLLDLSSLNRLSGANNLYAAPLSLPFKYRGIFLERSSVNVFLLKFDLFECKGIYEQLERSQCKEKVQGVAEWSILKENFESAAEQYRDKYEKYKKLKRWRRPRRWRRQQGERLEHNVSVIYTKSNLSRGLGNHWT